MLALKLAELAVTTAAAWAIFMAISCGLDLLVSINDGVQRMANVRDDV